MIYGDEDFNELLAKMLNPKGFRHACYEESCKHAEQMAWHFYGTKPTTLLERVRPREDPEVTKYRLDNYEPTTKSAADKAVHITSKIFNPNLYSIRWAEESQSKSAEELKDYTLEYYPKHNSIVNYMKDVVLRKMLADPNAVLVAKLSKVPQKQTEITKPILVVYGSPVIFNFDDDHYLINTKVDNDKVYYFEYYDKTQYISFSAFIDKQNQLVIDESAEESYVHSFGEIPVWPLTGMSEALDNGEVIFKSFYDSASPYWNLHIIHESDLFGAYITHLHPQKWVLMDQCNHKLQGEDGVYPCRGGVISMGNGLKQTCPQCKGTGKSGNSSPYGEYQINKEKLSEGDGISGIKPVEYITIPTEATAMLEKRTDEMIRRGMWAINMDIEDEVGENQSGVAKVIDRSAQYDTLFNIGTVMFETHIENAYYFFNKYMFAVSDASEGKQSDTNLPEINKPTQFDIVSTSELINNYKIAKESGLDTNYMVLKTQEILSRDLTTNTDLKLFTLLLSNLDPLAGFDAATIDRNVSRGYNSQTDAVIHFNLKPFVERAIRESKGFATQSKDQQLITLGKYADEMIAKNKPTLDMSMIENG